MKKNLFTKFLALFLTGTLLTNVGCKDYDSDIDNINKRLEDLQGTVALKTDLESLKKTQEAFNKIDFTSFVTNSALQTKLDQALGSYAKKSDLKAWLTNDEMLNVLKSKGYMTKTEIETLIANSSADADEVKTIFNNMLTSQAVMGKIQADVQKLIQDKLTEGKFVTEAQMKLFVEGKGYMTGSSDLSATQLNQVLTAVAGSVADKTSTVRTELNKWLGPELDKYMSTYIVGDEFKAAVGTEANAAILTTLNNANSDFAKKVQGLIEASVSAGLFETVDGKQVAIYAKASDLKTHQDAYIKQVSALWDAIGNLASRIQSLVFVPETTDANTAYFAGQTLGGKEMLDPRFELTFVVSPASLAEKIVENASLVSKSVTRAAAPTIAEKAGNNTTGEIKLVITDVVANYSNETAMAIALKIQDGVTTTNPDEKDSPVDTGIDFTSSYVALVTKGSTAINDNFVLVNKETGKAHDNSKVIYEMDYTVADAITIMGNYEVKYKDGANFITIADAATKNNWSVAPIIIWENTVAKFGDKNTNFATSGTSYTTAANLTASVFKQPNFIPTTPAANKGKEVAVQLKDINKPAAIDKAFYLKRIVKVQLGGNTPVAVTSFEGQVNVTKHSLGDFNFDLFINWNYGSWKAGYDANNWSTTTHTPATTADGTGKSYVTLTPGKLTAAQFNALVSSANGWVIKDKTNFKPELAADDLDITAVPNNTVVESTDAQTLKFTVKNYSIGFGSVVVEKTFDSGDGETITIMATLNFAQPFATADPSVALVSEIPFSTSAQAITSKDWIKTLYTSNKATLTKFGFASDALLTEYVALLAPNSTNTVEGVVIGTYPTYNATSHDLEVTLASVDFTNADGNYFTTTLVMENDKAPFGITFGEESKINVTKSAQSALAQQWQFGEKAWGVNPKTNGNKYEVKAVELLNYYNATVVDPTKKVVFSLVTDGMSDEDKAEVAKAMIDSENKLNWGLCNLTSLKLKASLVSTDNSSTFDVKEFTIDLKTPINVATIANRPAAETKQTLTAGGEQTIKLVNMLTWKDIDGNEVVDNAENNILFSTFAGPLCYKASIDWSAATVALTSGGKTLPNTPLTLGADGTIKYNITNIDATKTYQITVSGIIVGARYNEPKKDVSISFQLVSAN